MADVYTPSKEHAFGSTAPLDPARCKAEVYLRTGWGRTDQCTRKAGEDGWCKQHHPNAEIKRKQASDAAYEKRRRIDAMGWYGERMMAALIKIRDGDNDPRAVAEKALRGISYATQPQGEAS